MSLRFTSWVVTGFPKGSEEVGLKPFSRYESTNFEGKLQQELLITSERSYGREILETHDFRKKFSETVCGLYPPSTEPPFFAKLEKVN